jgi:hypothetical protein
MCDPRPKYSVELPGCQLFFLTKLKSDCTLGLRPAGVNHIPRPTLGVRFAPPPFPQRGTFCVAPEAYVFYTPRLLSKNKIDRGIASDYWGTPGGACPPARAEYLSFCLICLCFVGSRLDIPILFRIETETECPTSPTPRGTPGHTGKRTPPGRPASKYTEHPPAPASRVCHLPCRIYSQAVHRARKAQPIPNKQPADLSRLYNPQGI